MLCGPAVYVGVVPGLIQDYLGGRVTAVYASILLFSGYDGERRLKQSFMTSSDKVSYLAML